MYTTSGIICIDKDTHNFLIMQSRFHPKKWSFPKGYIHKNEEPLEAALRELYEETSIKLDKCNIEDETYTIDLKLDRPTKKVPSGVKKIKFFVSFVSQNIKIELSKEHSKCDWVSDFDNLKIPPEFIKLSERIKYEMLKK